MTEIYLMGEASHAGQSLEVADGFLYMPCRRRDVFNMLGYLNRPIELQNKRFAVVGPHHLVHDIYSNLWENGYCCVSYTDGMTALGSFDHFKPDIIFIHTTLSDMDSVEAIKMIIKIERGKGGVV